MSEKLMTLAEVKEALAAWSEYKPRSLTTEDYLAGQHLLGPPGPGHEEHLCALRTARAALEALTELHGAAGHLLEYSALSTKDICMDCQANEDGDVDVRVPENHAAECEFRALWAAVRRAAALLKEVDGE